MLEQNFPLSQQTGKFLVYTKRNGGCPICGSVSGTCRQKQDLTLCMPRHDDGVTGFKYLGETKDRLWGQYLPQGAVRPNRIKYERTTIKPNAASLSVEERNKAIKSVIQQLPLHETDIAELESRGMTNFSDFISARRDMVLETPVNPNLAGIAIDGRHFSLAANGYLIPIKNLEGLYVGFQHRCYYTEEGGGKYRWLKSGANKNRKTDATSHLPNGELPLQHALVEKRQENRSFSLYFCEGMLKPLVAAQIHSKNFIGGSGGRFPREQVKAALAAIEPTHVILCPDAGSRANPNVISGYHELFEIVKSCGKELIVLEWGQSNNKETGKDVDEIGKLTFFRAKRYPYLEWEEGQWLATQEKAETISWRNIRKYTPDFVFNEKYCTSPAFPEKGEVVALKYSTGQGKTTWIGSKINERSDNVFSLFNRNSLSAQFAEKYGFQEIKEVSKNYAEAREYGRTYAAKINSTTSNLKVCSCLESLLSYPLDWFTDATIILDEIESTLRQAFAGKTLGDRQNEVLNKLKAVLHTCGRVIISDGSLTDATCAWINQYARKKLIKYENLQKPARPKVFLYEHWTKSENFCAQISSESCPWIMSDSQITCEALEQYFVTKETGKTVIRFDAHSVAGEMREFYDAFKKNPDSCLEQAKKDFGDFILITSPLVESGLDVNWQGFTGVYLFGTHLECNSLIQMLARARDISCPRHLIVNEFVRQNKDGSKYHTAIYKNYRAAIERVLKVQVGFMVTPLPERFKEDWANFTPEKVTQEFFESKDHDLSTAYDCIRNYEVAFLREALSKRLVEGGYEITRIDLDFTKTQEAHTASHYYREAKAEVKVAQATEIFEAKEITEEEYWKKKERLDLNWKEKVEVTRFRFQYLANQELSTLGAYFFLFKNKLAIAQLELRYYAERLDEERDRECEKFFSNPTLTNYRSNLGFLRIVKKLDLLAKFKELAESGQAISSKTPFVAFLFAGWQGNVAAATRIERGKQPFTLFKRVASKFGFDLIEVESQRDKHTRYFRLEDSCKPEDCFPEIERTVAERLAREWAVAEEKSAKAASKKARKVVQTPVYDIANIRKIQLKNTGFAEASNPVLVRAEADDNHSLSSYTPEGSLSPILFSTEEAFEVDIPDKKWTPFTLADEKLLKPGQVVLTKEGYCLKIDRILTGFAVEGIWRQTKQSGLCQIDRIHAYCDW